MHEQELELERRFRTRISPFIRRHAATLASEAGERLLRQFEPSTLELFEHEGYTDDPLHEEDADIHPFADVVHKYRSKILYLTTDECPVYCRYCTRKRKTLLSPGHTVTPVETIANYLAERPEVNEVIFSGGDPLMLAPDDLMNRAGTFLRVGSIRFMRFHTRAVTTLPALVSRKFIDLLASVRQDFPKKTIAFVLHINTAEEIGREAQEKISALRNLDIPLFAQSVLLKGINDSAMLLAQLCHTLVMAGVQPYYLHQLDTVTGASHFEVQELVGKSIYEELRSLVPPYMLPRYVRDSKQGKYLL